MATGGKRDPSSHRMPAQITKLSRGYNATPEQIEKRSTRNKARREMVDRHGAAAVAGKDIDHKKPLRKGGTNADSNLRIADRHTNRGWEREKR